MKMMFKGEPDFVFPWLVHGCEYDIEVTKTPKKFNGNCLTVLINGNPCVYSSMESFYNNWGEVKRDVCEYCGMPLSNDSVRCKSCGAVVVM